MSKINNIFIYVIISNLQWRWTLVTVQSSKLNMDSVFVSVDLIFIIRLDEKLCSNEMMKDLWVFSHEMTAALCVFKQFQGAENI